MNDKRLTDPAPSLPQRPRFRLTPMTEEDGRQVCGWLYPEPYDRYRWPAWEQMVRQRKEFADPDIRKAQYLAVRDERGELAGYVQLFALDRAIRLGLGLRPDLCDRGYGKEVTLLAVREAAKRRPWAEIDLEVETWNRRAIRVYEKAGFRAQDEYERQAGHGAVRVLCMVWQGEPENSGVHVE
ncbi:GNAT family N-acetyltransferase [Cohnella pontilimi]|nr:GNAT family N-acetyltransferase [Cohnella pontilimi]